MGANIEFFAPNVSNKRDVQTSFFLDFQFNKIILYRNSLQFDNIQHQIIEKNITINYNSKNIKCNKAQVSVILYNKQRYSNKVIQIEMYIVDAQGQNVFGVGPNINYIIQDLNFVVSIDLYNNTVYYDEINVLQFSHYFQNEPQDNYHYLQSDLIYKNGIQAQRKARANICMHDNVFEEQQYFLQGSEGFVSDWNFFYSKFQKQQEQGLGNQFRFFVQGAQSVSNFDVYYDPVIFQFYDKIIFKKYDYRKFIKCDLFFGDFFYHRSGMKLHISREQGDTELSFTMELTNYINTTQSDSLFGYMIFVIIFVLVFVFLTSTFVYINKKQKPIENKWNRDFYVKKYEKLINQYYSLYIMDEQYYKNFIQERQEDLNEEENDIIKLKFYKKGSYFFERISNSLYIIVTRAVFQQVKQNQKKRKQKFKHMKKIKVMPQMKLKQLQDKKRIS